MNEKPRMGLLAYGMLTLIIFIAVHLFFRGLDSGIGTAVINKVENYLNINPTPAVIGTSDKETSIDGDDDLLYTTRYSLPNLQRMSKEDKKKYIDPLLMSQKAKELGITVNDCLTPEKKWKDIYSSVNPVLSYENKVDFTGTTTSELNKFLSSNQNSVVYIQQKTLNFDQPVVVPSDISIVGAPTTIVGSDEVNGAITLSDVENINISSLNVLDGRKGYYIKNCKNVLVEKSEITGCVDYGFIISGGSNIKLSNSKLDRNLSGLYIMSDANNIVIESNVITNSTAIANALAGIVIDSSSYVDPELYVKDSTIAQRTRCPHDIVVYGNYIAENRANGIYCVGPYYTYILQNTLKSNDKEGICLDWGTIGTFLANNDISYNGYRIDQTDEDLQHDYVGEFGRLEDGSSPAKLPGISLDNAMWNIIADNHIHNNAGSGIKSVRTAIENIIIQNSVVDNNAGQNSTFHFFGIELGYATGGEEQQKMDRKMDFTSNYGNIICRNMVNGPHYSGIYLADESYINDLFDNSILGCTHFSVESFTNMYNSSMNNYSNIPSLNFELTQPIYNIGLPASSN